MIIVTSYENPDLDGVGGSVGYAELLRFHGKEAEAALYGDPFVEAQWILDTFNIKPPKQLTDFDLQNSKVALIDTSYSETVHPDINLENVTSIIDHRKGGDVERFLNAQVQIELVGAAATLVAEHMKNAQMKPSPSTALLVLGGIVSNTMNFCSLNTTKRDHAMHEWLATFANPTKDFAEQMFQAKTELILADLNAAIRADGLVIRLKNVAVTQGQIEIIGVKKLLNTRYDEARNIMRAIQKEGGARYMLLSCVDLAAKTTDILVFDKESKALYSKALDIQFKEGIAHLDHIFLRKQMIPSIKKTLETYEK